MKGKTIVIIPALNEEESIGDVIEDIKDSATVLVIDDGSFDGTKDVARKHGALVIVHKKNLGYDASLNTGFGFAIKEKFDYLITLDADGQHNPCLISDFVGKLNEGADLVIGIRPNIQRFSEGIFSVVSKYLWKIEDPLCGIKGYRLEKFQGFGNFNRYNSIGTYFAVKAARTGLKIKQVNIEILPRKGIPRFGSGIRANFKILKALIMGIIKGM